MPDTKEGRPAYAIPAHSHPSIHGSAREHSSATDENSQDCDPAEAATYLLPIQEKAKRRRRSDTMLTRDHRTHPNAQINLDKRDPTARRRLILRPREILEYRLDHPTRRARRRSKHSDDGAMGAQQATERRWVRRRVDRTADA